MRAPVSPVRAVGAVGAVAALVGLSACGVVQREPNLIAGKTAFVQKCGTCHKLNRAGTTGVVGPDLDSSFQRALQNGMGRSSVEGVVRKQIEVPLREPQHDPVTGKELVQMPANLVKGKLVDDVASYVASATAKTGEDPGRLADIGAKKSNASTSEK